MDDYEWHLGSGGMFADDEIEQPRRRGHNTLDFGNEFCYVLFATIVLFVFAIFTGEFGVNIVGFFCFFGPPIYVVYLLIKIVYKEYKNIKGEIETKTDYSAKFKPNYIETGYVKCPKCGFAQPNTTAQKLESGYFAKCSKCNNAFFSRG